MSVTTAGEFGHYPPLPPGRGEGVLAAFKVALKTGSVLFRAARWDSFGERNGLSLTGSLKMATPFGNPHHISPRDLLIPGGEGGNPIRKGRGYSSAIFELIS